MTILNLPDSRSCRALGGLLVLWAGLTPALGQDMPASTAQTLSTVRDTAGMFDAEAVQKAKAQLQKIEQTYHVPTVVESDDFASVEEPIETVALRRARATGFEGIFILLAKKERKLAVKVTPRFTGILGKADTQAITNVFVEEFRRGHFDQGLERGVAEIERLLARAKLEGKTATASQEPLVLRNQVRLTLGGARKILAGAEAKAKELGLKVNIAVVDDGGHLIAFERMDGAQPASGFTATTKAVTAATVRASTGTVPSGTTSLDPLLNISLQNAAAASGGKLTTLLGGVPVVVEGQVIAGVGVDGGTGEQDAQVTRAGIEGLLVELEGRAAAPKEEPAAKK